MAFGLTVEILESEKTSMLITEGILLQLLLTKRATNMASAFYDWRKLVGKSNDTSTSVIQDRIVDQRSPQSDVVQHFFTSAMLPSPSSGMDSSCFKWLDLTTSARRSLRG